MSIHPKGIGPAAARARGVSEDSAASSTPPNANVSTLRHPAMNRGAPQDASAFERASAPVRKARTARPLNNGYRVSKNRGDYPPAGGLVEQARMGARAVTLAADALRSRLSNGRSPPDFLLNRFLLRLAPMPKIPKAPFHEGRFASSIPGVEPQRVFEHFATRLRDVFGSAGIGIRPSDEMMPRTADGAVRFMLEIPPRGLMPAAWFPMELRVDADTRTVELACLEGHPFRGSNTFKFLPDGEGGTVVFQVTQTQLSSRTLRLGELMGASERQEETWKAVHAHLFASFWPEEEGPHE